MSNTTKQGTRFRMGAMHTKLIRAIADAALIHGRAWRDDTTTREGQALAALVLQGYVVEARGTEEEAAFSDGPRYKLTLKGLYTIADLVRMVLLARMRRGRADEIYNGDIDKPERHQRWSLAETERRAACDDANHLAGKLRDMRRNEFAVLHTPMETEQLWGEWERINEEYTTAALKELVATQKAEAVLQEDRERYEIAMELANAEWATLPDANLAALCDVPYLSKDEEAVIAARADADAEDAVVDAVEYVAEAEATAAEQDTDATEKDAGEWAS